MGESKGDFVVKNKLGLHARAAAKLVQLASSFPCTVTIGRDEHKVNAKSVMGVLLLCGSKGTTLTLEAEGERAEEAVVKLGELIDNLFGEGE
jgi:phosphocarrier protein